MLVGPGSAENNKKSSNGSSVIKCKSTIPAVYPLNIILTMKISLNAVTVVGLSLFGKPPFTKATEVTFYENDFETPNQVPVLNCGSALDQTLINTMYGGSFSYSQAYTVETVILDSCWQGVPGSCAIPYANPDGIGGKYAIGMLRNREEDRLWFDFTYPSDLPYMNIDVDISSIDVNGCNGPYSPPGIQDPAVFKLTLFSGATILGSETITGAERSPNHWTFKWSHHRVVFAKGAATNLRLEFDLPDASSGYAVFDNLRIWGSDFVPPLGGGAEGDPHFQTWAGRWFDYMGMQESCLYLRVPRGSGDLTCFSSFQENAIWSCSTLPISKPTRPLSISMSAPRFVAAILTLRVLSSRLVKKLWKYQALVIIFSTVSPLHKSRA